MKLDSLAVGLIGTNCYLLWDETAGNAAAIVDPGGSADQILAKARSEAALEKQRAMDEVKGELADLAVDMAGRVLRFDEQARRNILVSAPKEGSRKGILKLAAPCDAEQLSAIIDRLERLLGCHLKLTTEIDSSLIGGFAALVDGKVYDFSYVTQLSAMQQKLA